MAARTVIGLDIGTTAVRAAEVDPGRTGAPVLVRYGEHPLPAGAVRDGEVADADTVARSLRALWATTRLSRRDVVLGVGSQRVTVRELTLPWLPLPELRASLPYRVAELMPAASGDVVLDFLPTARVGGGDAAQLRGLLVAAQRDTVMTNLRAVESAGLRVAAVDLTALALQRSLVGAELQSRTVALVDVGARQTHVVVVAAGHPRLVRIIPLGGQHATDAVADALHVDDEVADGLKRRLGLATTPDEGADAVAAEAIGRSSRSLADSVRSTLTYDASHHPGEAADLLVLSGGGVDLPGLAQHLSTTCRMPAVLGDATAGLVLGRGVPEALPVPRRSHVAAPVGLAVRSAA